MVKARGEEYRLWDPYRSKLAASILRGTKEITIKPRGRVLYLGAASGTTVSHVSDIVGDEGIVYAVEFAPRVARELVEKVAKHRRNVLPIFGDARFPEKYPPTIARADTIYCDVAQPEQAKVLADNADRYLGREREVMIAIKARSVDVVKRPSAIFEGEAKVLRGRGFEILEMLTLEPYERDHAMILALYRGH